MDNSRRLKLHLTTLMVLAVCGLGFAGWAATPASAGAAAGSSKPSDIVIKGGNYTFAAAPSTSPVYAYWVAIAKAVMSVYPQFNITVTETTGALDITKRVRARQAAMGNSMGNLDYNNYNGEEQFKGQPNPKARILWYYDHLIAQWAVAKSSGIKTIDGLNGREFNPGGAGGGIVSMTKNAFALFGVKPRYYEATQSSAMEAMVNRQIIGLSKAGPVPDSFFQQIAANMPIELVGLTKEQQAKAIEKYPYWSPFTIPAKTYGDSQEVRTIAVLVGAQTTSDLPEEVGYAFFKAMWEGGKAIWQAAYPSAANINALDMTLRSSIPLHAGAVRYLKEKGIAVPDRLIPPEYGPAK
jgi:TRAP transporter TAXI family solute receptor